MKWFQDAGIEASACARKLRLRLRIRLHLFSSRTLIRTLLGVVMKVKGVGVLCVRRCWRQLDVDSFRRAWPALQQSALIVTPPSNVDDFFTCDDAVLRLLLDKHVLMKVCRCRPTSANTVSMVRRRLSCYKTQKPTASYHTMAVVNRSIKGDVTFRLFLQVLVLDLTWPEYVIIIIILRPVYWW